uniref:Uncharacterized protein n=1 Tax=Siphoviridae sp. cttpk5 TaxID=2826496 RepID=A0A8S5NHP3_9CAUD|nr:MAG TPA: hypothetical protein [Siphoviridae sp. cttpk5]
MRWRHLKMLTLTYMKTMATELLIGGLGGRTFRT